MSISAKALRKSTQLQGVVDLAQLLAVPWSQYVQLIRLRCPQALSFHQLEALIHDFEAFPMEPVNDFVSVGRHGRVRIDDGCYRQDILFCDHGLTSALILFR